MYYYRGRHYDPRIGRFIQRDPIDMMDDVNLYRYVGNNPMNYTDPMGLASKQVVPERTFLQKTYDNTVYAGEVAYGGLATAAQWTNGARQSMPDFIQNRLEGAGQTIIGGETTIRGAIETAGAGGGCIAGGRGCVALPVAISDLVGGVNDMGKGFFYGLIGGQKTTEGFYPVEKSIEATAGNGLAGVTLNVAVNIDPKGAWKGIKNGFGALVEYAMKKGDEIPGSLTPLGRGTTKGGRYVPNTLEEQLAMKEIMSNPGGGMKLSVNMTDTRRPGADGWVKMSNETAHGVEIHYVAQFDSNGNIIAIDDFKFKDQ